MKRRHFETLRPVCPACRPAVDAEGAPLALASVWTGLPDDVVEGVLRCTRPSCQCEFPILDGIPVIVPRVREFLASNAQQFSLREDLCGEAQSLLAEACGPGSWLDAIRQHISNYAWDHYAEFDPAEAPEGGAHPGLAARTLHESAEHLSLPLDAPVLDAGCSVGRSSFELAALTRGPVLGIDLHIPMLRLARSVMRRGRVTYARRRVGMLYDQRSFPVPFESRTDRVDFWACDATALPFAPGTFGAAVSLNVLDCAASPLDHLRSVASVLRPGARAVFTTPYDWSLNAAPIEAWIGGHSPRGYFAGDSSAVLRALLTPGGHPAAINTLRMVSERVRVPWHVRVHERSVVKYDVHMVVAEASRAG